MLMVTFLKKYLLVFKRNKVPEELQLRFLKRLSRLLLEGYPMIEALEVIKWDKQMIAISNEVISSLKNGSSLDAALEVSNFHSTITDYLYFVRPNGDIQLNLDNCINMYEERLKYVKKFQEIARYPLILLFVFSILLFFIKQSVLPSFSELFQSSSDASQTISLFINIIEYSGIFVGIFLVILLIVLSFWHFNKNKLTIKRQINIFNKIPVYRTFISLQVSFQFSMYLSTMLRSGMPLREVLASMAEQKKQPIISYYAALMTKELSLGLGLTSLLLKFHFLDERISLIFRKNTDIKALEKDLSVYADLLTDELERKTLKILTLVQPVIFIILACFVVFIYMTLMLPMYQLIKTI